MVTRWDMVKRDGVTATEETIRELDIAGKSETEKVKIIYDYVTRRGEGARGFFLLAVQSGIPCVLVDGTPHTWIMVRVGEKYYFADPVSDKGKDRYDYFLLGSDRFLADHRISEISLGMRSLSEGDYKPMKKRIRRRKRYGTG